MRGSKNFRVTWTMFASQRASRPARTAIVAVAVVVGYYCDGSWKSAAGDRPADSVAVPVTVDNRYRLWSVVGCSTAAAVAAPRPAVTHRSMADHVAPEGVTDELPDPSPRASCPTPLASHATWIVRNPDHRICPDLVPPEPEKTYDAALLKNCFIIFKF